MTTTARTITTRIITSATRSTRTRIGNHMSIARRHAVLDAYIARVNGSLTTAAAYLAGHGVTQAFIDQYGSAFGTKVSKAYQTKFGHKATRTAVARRGLRLFNAFAYTTDELPVLDDAARGYNRTQGLVAA